MKLITLKCDSCNAQLKLDLDNMQSYCPYCGSYLLLDPEDTGQTMSTIITERGKTKRTALRTGAFGDYLKYKEKKREDQQKYALKAAGILFALAILLIILLIVVLKQEEREHENMIQIKVSARSLKGESYESVVNQFEDMGFDDVKAISEGDLVTGLLSKEGTVSKVTIDGKSNFKADEWVDQDATIRVYYHSFKDD